MVNSRFHSKPQQRIAASSQQGVSPRSTISPKNSCIPKRSRKADDTNPAHASLKQNGGKVPCSARKMPGHIDHCDTGGGLTGRQKLTVGNRLQLLPFWRLVEFPKADRRLIWSARFVLHSLNRDPEGAAINPMALRKGRQEMRCMPRTGPPDAYRAIAAGLQHSDKSIGQKTPKLPSSTPPPSRF